MELELTRETLCFERLVKRGGEQVTIEGEATLPGSMRDAVTVLSVQAQAYITDAQAGRDEAQVRGRVQFRVLYTQGDLTRIRTLETGCSFENSIALSGISAQMEVEAAAVVLDTKGQAGSGRITLSALLELRAEVFEKVKKDWITDAVQPGDEQNNLQKRSQMVSCCVRDTLGEGKQLVREEFELDAHMGVDAVLSVTALAQPPELSGGNGRICLGGVIQVRTMYRPKESGRPLIVTEHEMPYEIIVNAKAKQDAQLQAEAVVTDVMADCAQTAEGCILRVEAQVNAVLRSYGQQEIQILEDIYSVSGDMLEPQMQQTDILTFEERQDVRESLRLQTALPADAPPLGTLLAAFVSPSLSDIKPSGRRINAQGIAAVTILYLPQDSDIPLSVKVHEPFCVTFPVEMRGNIGTQVYCIQAQAGASTSDRAEIRCVLGLRAVQYGVTRVCGIQDIGIRPEEKQERGFVIVWPQAGESRWDTARRLRVPPENLHPAGTHALMAFKK